MTYSAKHVEQRRNRTGAYRKAIAQLVDQLLDAAPYMATDAQKAVVFDRFVEAANEKKETLR